MSKHGREHLWIEYASYSHQRNETTKIVMTDLITPEEVAHIRTNATCIDIPKHIREGTMPPIPPSRPLKSGYSVVMTIEIFPGTSEIEHVSVIGKNDTDPAEAETIAKEILGDDYIVIGVMRHGSTNNHFAKVSQKDKAIFLKAVQDTRDK